MARGPGNPERADSAVTVPRSLETKERTARRGRADPSLARDHEPAAHAVQRSLQALVMLGGSPEGLTISEMAIALETSRPAIYRLVAALQSEGFALRGGDGRIRLGPAVLDLARQVYPVLRSVATPVLRKLADRALATAHLTVVVDDEAVAVAVVEPARTNLHVAYRVGTRHPLDRGAAGRAILDLRRSQGTTRSRTDTTSRGSAQKTVASAREAAPAAWVLSEGELQSDARGLAAPLRGTSGLEASVGVVCLSELDAERVGPLVVQAATELALLLRGSERDDGPTADDHPTAQSSTTAPATPAPDLAPSWNDTILPP
jgi:DNA-binding IclR family transcriptional regulator